MRRRALRNRVRVHPISLLRCGLVAATILTLGAIQSQAQWEILPSPTTAGLRGIHALGNGIAWASGTEGTILRTTDDGAHWQLCTTPPAAEHLDFRGIQAFDAQTAIVMSSGKGDLSRLYKTIDGCKTWKLQFTNPDKEGFWDAIHRTADGHDYVLGDPVNGRFAMFVDDDGGETWFVAAEAGRESTEGDTAFAASNTALSSYGPYLLFGTGGSSGSHTYLTQLKCSPPPENPTGPAITNCVIQFAKWDTPLAYGRPTSGIYSISARATTAKNGISTATVVAVGGASDQVDTSSGTSANSSDGGQHWLPAATPPHGYRSAVTYSPTTKTWITVGPNGTDISTDDGRNWRALNPNPASGEDRDWNALSLPFVVGPHGRIGRLRPDALAPPSGSSKR